MIDRDALNERLTRLIREMDEIADALYAFDPEMGWLSDRLNRDGADLEQYQIRHL